MMILFTSVYRVFCWQFKFLVQMLVFFDDPMSFTVLWALHKVKSQFWIFDSAVKCSSLCPSYLSSLPFPHVTTLAGSFFLGEWMRRPHGDVPRIKLLTLEIQ